MNAITNHSATSTAREKLANHLKSIEAAHAAFDKSKEPLARLEGLQAALQAAQGELSRFAAGEAQKLSAWAEAGHGVSPEGDHAARRKLEGKHADAAAAVQAASQAAVAFQAAANDARLRHAELDSQTGGKILDVLLESGISLVARRKELETELAGINVEIFGLRQVMGKNPATPQFQQLLTLDTRLGFQPDEQAANFAATANWAALAQRLATNPAAM